MAKGCVLIVDDHATNIELLASLLLLKGYDVRCALSGAEALETARAAPIDLVMLDIAMPDIDGYEVCRRLKADALTADVPVIFISALGEPMDKVEAFQVGGADYITKPFQIEEVLARVENQLRITRLQNEMRRANARLRELDQMRGRLAAMLVHDLRSPLMTIQWTFDVLRRDSPLDVGARRELLEVSSQSVAKLIGLIGDMLEIYRSDDTGSGLALEPLDVAPVLAACERSARIAARAKGIAFEAAIEPGPLAIVGDAQKLDRAVSNLLSNAVKFTPIGGTVALSARVNAKPRRLVINVRDSGRGIDVAELPHIFDAYRQADGAKEMGGVGLGLAIVKRIVEAHGGTIHVESRIGAGASFTIELPARLEVACSAGASPA
jgi:two-component system sensor histidine kinase/response regulator